VLPDGLAVHWRIQTAVLNGMPVTIGATAPAHAIATPLRQAFFPLAVCLVALGLLLYLASLLQVRIGLKPLASLREKIAAIRSGKNVGMVGQEPAEIQPLVDEINSLLADNLAGLERARRNAANLAHGLKTPLASMSMSLQNPATRDLATLRAEVERMNRLIRHHLSRSRAATVGGSARASTAVAPRLDDLVALMRGVYSERNLAIDADAPKELEAAIEQQDFDEITGNLLDNACKWAETRVAVEVRPSASNLLMSFEDDGPGIAADKLPDVLRPGHRLDEATPGYGFGLSITRELVELYGGTITLRRSSHGGLRVDVLLPAA
jgi:signal transduction histidine kinase